MQGYTNWTLLGVDLARLISVGSEQKFPFSKLIELIKSTSNER